MDEVSCATLSAAVTSIFNKPRAERANSAFFFAHVLFVDKIASCFDFFCVI